MKRIGFILLLFTSSVGFAQKYAVILCSAVSGDIRTKLTFNQL